jgi:EAL domain-containing protein (putative c-di-GMP-specific phosphodiesterase class I)
MPERTKALQASRHPSVPVSLPRNRLAPSPLVDLSPDAVDTFEPQIASLAAPTVPQSLAERDRLLDLVRVELGMDVVVVSEFVHGLEKVRALRGHGIPFGLREGGSSPLPNTWSQRMIDGRFPNVVKDARADGRAQGILAPPDGAIGSYIGVPLEFSDGRLYGALWCASLESSPSLQERDVRFMRLLARLLAEQFELHDAEWKSRSVIARRVRELLDGPSLPMVYQPIFELRSRSVVGVEALARFPTRRLLAPERWFAEASAVGLGIDLELLAVRSALTSLETLPPPTFLAVNISPQTLVSPRLRRALEGVRPDRIILELTEHQKVYDYTRLNRTLIVLRSSGVRLAIDDVGAGFASLKHILRLCPDVLKLDTALTAGVHFDPVRRALAASLVSFASQTGATMVAEGVETSEQLRALEDLGVAHGQGYWLALPARLEQLALTG